MTLTLLSLLGCSTGSLGIDARLSSDSLSLSRVEEGSSTLTVGQAEDGSLLSIEQVLMAVGEIELEGKFEAQEFETGAQLIEIALGGQSTEIAIQDVPAGWYDELELELMRADGAGFAEFDGGEPASILVLGTYNGASFAYRSTATPELEFGVDARIPPGGHARIAIAIDVASWFLAEDGTILDPLDLSNTQQIEDNIRSSMEAVAEVEDEDHDDEHEDDDDEHEDDDD